MTLIQRCFLPPSKDNYFLFGPRGTGKSTLIRSLYPNALWIDLLKPEVLRTYLNWPERLADHLKAMNAQPVIVIDEVQKAPQLLSVVHQLIEEKKSIQFILTGSSARKIKRSGADLLGGRALKCEMHPFIAAELGDIFSLEHALKYGMLPLLSERENPTAILHAYISLYLNEEIQAEGLVRNIENFSRFLEVSSFSHGTQLNLTNIARECAVKRKTVENYVDILEELLLAYRLPVFTKRAQRALSAHPKFYLFDAGVFRTLRPSGHLDRIQEIEGPALEGLVAQHLYAWRDYSQEKCSLYYWRTRSGVEVDFVIYGSNNFWALEVKNASSVQPKDTRPLEVFLKDYPEAKGILLYRGTSTFVQKNVLCLPCEKFLKQLRPNEVLFNNGWIQR